MRRSRSTGRSAGRGASPGPAPPAPTGYQSTGLWACWRRYGLVSPARRLVCFGGAAAGSAIRPIVVAYAFGAWRRTRCRGSCRRARLRIRQSLAVGPGPARARSAPDPDRQRDRGLCGGMIFVARDRFERDEPVPVLSAPPDPSEPLFREIVDRQSASFGSLLIVPIRFWLGRRGEPGGRATETIALEAGRRSSARSIAGQLRRWSGSIRLATRNPFAPRARAPGRRLSLRGVGGAGRDLGLRPERSRQRRCRALVRTRAGWRTSLRLSTSGAADRPARAARTSRLAASGAPARDRTAVPDRGRRRSARARPGRGVGRGSSGPGSRTPRTTPVTRLSRAAQAIANAAPKPEARAPVIEPAERRRAGEDRRVHAHDPASELVGNVELDEGVCGRRHARCRRRRRRTSPRRRAAWSRRRQHDSRGAERRPAEADHQRRRPAREGDPEGRDDGADPGRRHEEPVAGRVAMQHVLANGGITTVKFMPNVDTSPTVRIGSSTIPSGERSGGPRQVVDRRRDVVGRSIPGRVWRSSLAHGEQGDDDGEDTRRRRSGTPTPTPNAPIVSPATAGPMTRAPLNIAELRATALPTSSRPTISTANAWRVGMSMAFRMPSRNAMTRTCQTCDRVGQHENGHREARARIANALGARPSCGASAASRR